MKTRVTMTSKCRINK